MLNFIESIPGPLFLLYYIILMVACFGLAWFLLNAPDGSTAYRLPLSKRHSPMAIAISTADFVFIRMSPFLVVDS